MLVSGFSRILAARPAAANYGGPSGGRSSFKELWRPQIYKHNKFDNNMSSNNLSIGMGAAGAVCLLFFGIFTLVYVFSTKTEVVEIPGSVGIAKASGCASDNVVVQNTLTNVSLADTAQLITTDHGSFGVDWTPNPDSTPPATGDGDGGSDDPPSTPPANTQGLGTAVYYKYGNKSSKEQTSDVCASHIAKQVTTASKTISLIRVTKNQQWALWPMIFSLMFAFVFFGVLIGVNFGHMSAPAENPE